MGLTFSLLATDPGSAARRGRIETCHGVIETPVFMSVGTFGSVRILKHEDLEQCGTQIILGNTYHLYLRPGEKILREFGGYHNFISWQRPILTDSGGFQVFSLAHQRQISEKGVTFKSYVDNSYQFLSPETDIAFQEVIGSDIMMMLDVCVPSTSSYDVSAEAMQRTHRWAVRGKKAQRRHENSLFGIVQGAVYEPLRKESAAFLTEQNFDGYAIGGLAVGEPEEERVHYTRFTAALLPQHKPRYLMGVGTPRDIVQAVAAGVDMFDCIIPTNHARQGVAYTFSGKVKLRRSAHAFDKLPMDPECGCTACRRYSRAHLHQLLKSEEPAGWHLVALHNTWFYERLMERIRTEIASGTYASFVKDFITRVYPVGE